MTAAWVVAGLGALAIGCARRGTRAGAPVDPPDRPAGPVGQDAGPAPVPRRGGRAARWWAATLDDAAVDGDPRGWARAAAVTLVTVAAAGAWRGGPVGACVLGATAVAAGALVLRARRGRRGREVDHRLPDLLDQVARGLRSGLDLRSALAVATTDGGPHGAEVARVVDRIDGGASPAVALRRWVEDHPRTPVRTTAAALTVVAATGGRSAAALEGVAASLRARQATTAEAHGLATQARASAAVMVALPAVVGGIGVLTDPAVAATLFGTPWGLGSLGLAVVLDLTGAWWMHRVVTAAAP